ncbi:MAG: tRNA (adenosine(37)-N6)-threonylcarbamoyltransferase complex ATPase subunit type 1 TsaE [Bacteroidales bacterium]
MKQDIIIQNLEDLDKAAKIILSKVPDQRVFAFFGEMGVGKTTFIKALCKELDVTDTVNSPTFSLVNEYHTTEGESIFHFDFYRIKKLEEVYDIGYEDYLYSDSYCFLEWPELIEQLLPENIVNIYITENKENHNRKISYQINHQ